jgi:hypothetical protein
LLDLGADKSGTWARAKGIFDDHVARV